MRCSIISIEKNFRGRRHGRSRGRRRRHRAHPRCLRRAWLSRRADGRSPRRARALSTRDRQAALAASRHFLRPNRPRFSACTPSSRSVASSRSSSSCRAVSFFGISTLNWIDLIAAAVLADARDALAAPHDHVARLRARLELDGRGAVAVVLERVDLDLAAERRLDEADRDLGEDVVAVALEPLVALDVEHDVEMTGRAARRALALAGEAQRLAVVDAGRHRDRQRRGLGLGAAAAAVRRTDP